MVQSNATEIEDLRREVASLHGQLATERDVRTARRRHILSRSLTVLAALATTLALLGVWTFRTLTDTDLFVARVGPVIEQPEVAAAIGRAAAAELVDALQLEDRLRQTLPAEVAAAAGPISSAAENFLADGATSLMQTEQFRAAWDAALASGHRISIAVLSGKDTAAVQTSGGMIVLDLTPVINELLSQGSQMVSDLLGRQIGAPTVSAQTVEDATKALEDRLGVDLPADFGKVTLFASDNLATAQSAYQTMRVSVWLAPLAALVLAGLAIAASTRRLRTALSIVVGSGLLVVLVGLMIQPLKSSIVASVQEQGLSGAVTAGFDTVFGSLRTGIVVVVALAIVAVVLLYLTGSTRGAATTRALAGRAPSLAASYRGWFLGGGALVAFIVLAAIPGRSWGQLLAVLSIYALYALAVLVAPQGGDDDGQASPADDEGRVPDGATAVTGES
jgi:hypothetical protein